MTLVAEEMRIRFHWESQFCQILEKLRKMQEKITDTRYFEPNFVDRHEILFDLQSKLKKNKKEFDELGLNWEYNQFVVVELKSASRMWVFLIRKFNQRI